MPGGRRCGRGGDAKEPRLCYIVHMTKLLENGIDAVRDLPADQQNLAGELLLSLAEQSKRRPSLTPEQIDDVRLAIAEADRGDFATEEEMAAFWKKCGL
ncbi:MAG: hypothetical protein V7608_4538 [Hyphomicrobiales bacterium]|jgi:hypothetical protein